MLVNKAWLLTPERALVHLATATAILADMHLGYCEARQGGGEAVPLADLDETVAVFERLHSRHKIRRVVVAGDLIENRAGLEIASRFHASLGGMGIELMIVPGNHDRGLLAAGLPVQERITLAGWRIVHGWGALPRGRTIIGHHHPAMRIDGRLLPCFLIGRRRMILPAFSEDATGSRSFLRGSNADESLTDCQTIAIAGNRLIALTASGSKARLSLPSPSGRGAGVRGNL